MFLPAEFFHWVFSFQPPPLKTGFLSAPRTGLMLSQ